MKFKEKFLIFTFALIVSVLVFNWIASSSVCLMKTAKEAGYENMAKYRGSCEAEVSQARPIDDRALQLSRLR